MRRIGPVGKRFAIAFGVTFALMGLIYQTLGLIINTSASLPPKYFLHLRHYKPSKGDISLFTHEGRRLIKVIGGIAGDEIHYDKDGNLWVGDLNVGTPLTQDSQGHPLTPVSPGVIAQGFVFVYTPHPRSLDSRYASIGLISLERLEGTLIPLGGRA
jgi:type IV secretory pathway protease TraF